MKKLSQIFDLKKSFNLSFKRFPLQSIIIIVLVIITTTVTSLEWAGEDLSDKTLTNITRFSIVLIGVFFYSLAFRLYFERNKAKFKFMELVINLIPTIVLTALAIAIPFNQDSNENNGSYLAYAILTIIAVGASLISIAPFFKKNESNGQLRFIGKLIQRFLVTQLFSWILFLGFGGAFLLFDVLIEVDVPGEIYIYLGIIFFQIFFLFFMLSGIPSNFDELEKETSYPRFFKLFFSGIIFPLVFTYLVILLIYIIKIIIEWELPENQLVYLIAALLIPGLITVYALSELKNERRIRLMINFFHIFSLPLIALYFVSIYVRIDNYGLTVQRVSLVYTGVWLVSIFIYSLLNRRESALKFALTTSVLISLISILPFVGVFSLAKNNQLGRLKDELEVIDALDENGKVDPLSSSEAKDVNDESEALISSIVTYLVDTHGVKSLKPLFENEDEYNDFVDSAGSNYVSYNFEFMDYLGLNYTYDWEVGSSSEEYYYDYRNTEYFDFNVGDGQGIELDGSYSYLYMTNLYSYSTENFSDSFMVKDEVYTLTFDSNKLLLTLAVGGEELDEFDIEKYLDKNIEELLQSYYSYSNDEESVKFQGNNSTFYLTSLYGSKNSETNEVKVTSVNGYILIK